MQRLNLEWICISRSQTEFFNSYSSDTFSCIGILSVSFADISVNVSRFALEFTLQSLKSQACPKINLAVLTREY
jgi:hypothetical protein